MVICLELSADLHMAQLMPLPLTVSCFSKIQNGNTNLDFTEARDSEWQWHQLGHMQVCTLLQTDNHASTSPLSFFTGRMPFLPPNQQRQSTEGSLSIIINAVQINNCLNSHCISEIYSSLVKRVTAKARP